ncbi:ammonium transporter AmtB-like domain-containing protein [Dunaliella salina]|uniref:Ammonium transporter AmtB-like domain-containing protein n=1 Tax=Dunaliella salina TaxID=3046 RepID=A0ABQ7FXE1_DUNSA|nr:ammonium transporter AmtB-like domain-containing protein [Dunaliella salina]|eukprot:KAF5827019.1 ammonium transporter AmtB-like domain-containing protein [Dunaliella salina]
MAMEGPGDMSDGLKHYIDDAVQHAVDSALHSHHGHDGRSLLQLPDSPFTLDDVDSNTDLVESLNQLRQAVSNVQSEVGSKADAASTNIFFLVYGGTIVFLMQLGFAMLTSGFVRMKNINNILLKNLMDASVASICWYVLGYGFAYGVSDHRSNAFIVLESPHADAASHVPCLFSTFTQHHPYSIAYITTFSSMSSAPPVLPSSHIHEYYFFQWAFVATTATIVSGGVAERITFVGYMSYVVWMVSWVYPVVAHSVWATGGWLHGFVSYAVPEAWYAFNPGSQLAVATPANAAIVARNAVTTTLAAASGGITCLFFKFWRSGQLCVLSTCNGLLSGMVGVTAGPSLVEPWAALICGAFGALVFYGSEIVMHKLKIDDPVGAWSVHGAAGIYSVIFIGFFAKHDYVKEVYGNPVSSRRYGWFYGGHGQVMLCNIIELIFIILWVGINFYLLFGLLYVTKKLRVSAGATKHLSELTGHQTGNYGGSCLCTLVG